MIANCRVVLVRTHYPGNIGSAARAMKNFGLHDLVLVDPIASVVAHEARMLATNGVEILDAARIVATFEEAVADCGVVIATGGEVLGTKRETVIGTPSDLLPAFAESLSTGPCAIVFGPEPHGLSTDEISRCHSLLHLPTDPAYSSLNLSLSVGLCLYELRNHVVRLTDTPMVVRRPIAPYVDLDRAFVHLENSLTAMQFLYGQNAKLLMHAVRHLIGRAQPTPQEVKMLHGLARQLDYIADRFQKAETLLARGK